MTGEGYMQEGESKREKRKGPKNGRVKQMRLARTRGKAVALAPEGGEATGFEHREGKGKPGVLQLTPLSF